MTIARPTLRLLASLVIATLIVTSLTTARAADKDDHQLSLGDGAFKLKAPDKWERKEPKSRIVEHEFAVPAAEGDDQPGRVTVMGAGGSVDANVERWMGQFTQEDGTTTKEKSKIEKKTIAGQEVHLVDISGTYRDQAGPFANAVAVERPNYRMLAAVIVGGQKSGNYFIKFYGPRRTVTENEKAFHAMIDDLQAK